MCRFRRVLAVALVVALVAACGACASTSMGVGNGSGAASTPAPVPTRTIAVPPPKACSSSDCTLFASDDLGSGFAISVHNNSTAGVAIVELAYHGTPLYWHVFRFETPAEFACDVAGSVRNCVLVDYTGAHAAIAHPIVLATATLLIGKEVVSDTPDLHPADLDGDNRIDAYGLHNDYDPDYASGKVRWQTWSRSADGRSFASTGCGPLSQTAPPAPTSFLAGACS
jgi:hypothetical protein